MNQNDALWTALYAVAALLTLVALDFLLKRRYSKRPEAAFRIQLIMLAGTMVAFLTVIVIAPIEPDRRTNVLEVLGVVLSAVIALSSTTFVGNAMAGVLLRVVKNFRLGDFLKTGEVFGRVTERGLFHTELQTEESDLTTLPNLLLVSQPVTVVRASGTIISATVSLGYDVPRSRVKECLIEAAQRIGLQEPFVQILTLGDFSVTYRISGLLKEVHLLLSTRSRLKGAVLDSLHSGGIEIVSPTFMNQRQLEPTRNFIPPTRLGGEPMEPAKAEKVAFTKADLAEQRERLKGDLKQLTSELAERRKAGDDASGVEELEARIRRLEGQLEAMDAQLEPPGDDIG